MKKRHVKGYKKRKSPRRRTVNTPPFAKLTRAVRYGNSLHVCITSEVRARLGIAQGDYLRCEINGASIRFTKVKLDNALNLIARQAKAEAKARHKAIDEKMRNAKQLTLPNVA